MNIKSPRSFNIYDFNSGFFWNGTKQFSRKEAPSCWCSLSPFTGVVRISALGRRIGTIHQGRTYLHRHGFSDVSGSYSHRQNEAPPHTNYSTISISGSWTQDFTETWNERTGIMTRVGVTNFENSSGTYKDMLWTEAVPIYAWRKSVWGKPPQSGGGSWGSQHAGAFNSRMSPSFHQVYETINTPDRREEKVVASWLWWDHLGWQEIGRGSRISQFSEENTDERYDAYLDELITSAEPHVSGFNPAYCSFEICAYRLGNIQGGAATSWPWGHFPNDRYSIERSAALARKAQAETKLQTAQNADRPWDILCAQEEIKVCELWLKFAEEYAEEQAEYWTLDYYSPEHNAWLSDPERLSKIRFTVRFPPSGSSFWWPVARGFDEYSLSVNSLHSNAAKTMFRYAIFETSQPRFHTESPDPQWQTRFTEIQDEHDGVNVISKTITSKPTPILNGPEDSPTTRQSYVFTSGTVRAPNFAGERVINGPLFTEEDPHVSNWGYQSRAISDTKPGFPQYLPVEGDGFVPMYLRETRSGDVDGYQRFFLGQYSGYGYGGGGGGETQFWDFEWEFPEDELSSRLIRRLSFQGIGTALWHLSFLDWGKPVSNTRREYQDGTVVVLSEPLNHEQWFSERLEYVNTPWDAEEEPKRPPTYNEPSIRPPSVWAQFPQAIRYISKGGRVIVLARSHYQNTFLLPASADRRREDVDVEWNWLEATVNYHENTSGRTSFGEKSESVSYPDEPMHNPNRMRVNEPEWRELSLPAQNGQRIWLTAPWATNRWFWRPRPVTKVICPGGGGGGGGGSGGDGAGRAGRGYWQKKGKTGYNLGKIGGTTVRGDGIASTRDGKVTSNVPATDGESATVGGTTVTDGRTGNGIISQIPNFAAGLISSFGRAFGALGTIASNATRAAQNSADSIFSASRNSLNANNNNPHGGVDRNSPNYNPNPPMDDRYISGVAPVLTVGGGGSTGSGGFGGSHGAQTPAWGGYWGNNSNGTSWQGSYGTTSRGTGYHQSSYYKGPGNWGYRYDEW
jgi:hypothetical protein